MSKLEAVLWAVAFAIAAPVGNALLTLNDATFSDPMPWVRALIIGLAVAVGALMLKWSQSHGPVITITPRSAIAPPSTDSPASTFPLGGLPDPQAAFAALPVEAQQAQQAMLPDHAGTLPRPIAASPPVDGGVVG